MQSLYRKKFMALPVLFCFAACGEGAEDIARRGEDIAQQVADSVEEGASDVAEAAQDAGADTSRAAQRAASTVAQMFTEATDSVQQLLDDGAQALGQWVNGPPLAQRRQKCAEENGMFMESVHIDPCVDSRTRIGVGDLAYDQACEGPTTGDTLEWQCVHIARDGQPYFNDGPSVPHVLQRMGELISERVNFLLWNSIFWEAAVNHDYCYHHGATTYGYDQPTCDGQFIDDLMALCLSNPDSDAAWFSEDDCISNAHGMYAAVRSCGGDSYSIMNTRVAYPTYEPMYRKLGLKEQPKDEAMRRMIEDYTQ